MNKFVFPTKAAGSIEISTGDAYSFVCFKQSDFGQDNIILINKRDWNEFVHNLTLFNINEPRT